MVILEGYGLTETASTTTFNPSAAERRAYSVGKPIWGTRPRSGTTQERPLPPGPEHVGEIVTRGMHVMKGYLNRPEATAEALHRRLAAHRRSWLRRRGRLLVHRQPEEGADHPGRVQRVPARDRERAATPTRPWPRPPWSACPTSGSARKSWPWFVAGHDGTGRARARHLVPGAAGRLQVPADLPVPRRTAEEHPRQGPEGRTGAGGKNIMTAQAARSRGRTTTTPPPPPRTREEHVVAAFMTARELVPGSLMPLTGAAALPARTLPSACRLSR